ncbi:MAG: TraR/DksA family transcriptional regulator [Saprospiraceae bacterium]|nr:TraR/DksA family transcriptional regulator [Saprospiraceae bacterium]
MSAPGNVTTRYTDEDLKEFKDIIDKKLEKAKEQYQSLRDQLKDITENNNDDFAKDITDFSSLQSEVEMLNNMANHQRKYIQDLENALIRINNKSYGICVVSGELIDKKRLMAVPTTTKSVTAKTQSEMKDVMVVPKEKQRGFDDLDEEDEKPKSATKSEPRKPVIITKVIKKSGTAKVVNPLDDDDLDKIFSELDVIKELDEAELNIDEEDDDNYDVDSDEDLDMIADDEPEDYDDDDN